MRSATPAGALDERRATRRGTGIGPGENGIVTTDAAIADGPVATATQPGERTSYGEIVKSSVLIGGSAVIGLAVTMIRTKAIALILGPAGFGLMGLFTSIADLTRSVAEVGINSSGVRQIAEAVGTGDSQKIARTITILRRTAIALGLIGAAVLLVFAQQISRITFDSPRYASGIRLLSLAVFFRLVAEGQGALIQGLRRLGDLARINIIGAVIGTIAAVPLVFWLGSDGVALALVAVAITGALTSWHYSRKVVVEKPQWAASQVRHELHGLLRTGLAFMASNFLVMGTSYAVRLLVTHHDGIAAAGLYQAAWTIGGLYVGFLLQAMGADFYPRLVGMISDHECSNQIVNEQTQIGMLIAVPGVLLTISLAPLVIILIYSREFLGAVEVLRWVCLGMVLRIVSWPIGFIVVAKGRQALFFLTEFAWTVASLLLAWWAVSAFGVVGAGLAFFLSYVFHAAMMYPLSRHLTGFRWSSANKRLAVGYALVIGVAIVGCRVLPPVAAIVSGCTLTLAVSVHSLRQMATLIPPTHLPRALRWVVSLSNKVWH